MEAAAYPSVTLISGLLPKMGAKSAFPAVRVTDRRNASPARSVIPPWSGRQMASFLSQCKPRNTHLVPQELLGHATIAITLDTYSHVLPGMADHAATMEDALS